MNYSIVFYIIGWILNFEAAFMALPTAVALIYRESEVWCFLATMAVCLMVGMLLVRRKPKNQIFYVAESFVAVSLSWVLLSVMGAAPFVLSGYIPNPIDALFETVSGFTTTGASILSSVEQLPNCLLFWRSFTHWIGGMGVLVFLLSVLPMVGGSHMNLMKAESPGPIVSRLVPKVQMTAKLLYQIYLGMTILEAVILILGKMPIFDAITITVGTAGTGGFAIKNTSIGAYNNSYYEIIITIFMILFGVNFNMYYFLLIKDFKQVFKNEELRAYLGVILFSIVCITINILSMYNFDVLKSIRLASFQVGSIITTTGYSSCDYSVWPQFSKMILFLLTVCGASAGSTGGGVKISRLLIIVKKIKLDIQKLLHPQKVEAITMDGKVVDTEVVNQIMAYFCSFIIIVGILFFLISFNNFDFETTITSVITCIGNVGPGYGLCGPMGNFSMFSDFSKIVLSFAMLIGRLEIYPIIIFLSPVLGIRNVSKSFHKRNKRKI